MCVCFSLVWHCSIWSWVKERGCKALIRTVNSWTTIDGKLLVCRSHPTLLPKWFCSLRQNVSSLFSSSHFVFLFFQPQTFCPGLSWCFQWRGSCSASPAHRSPPPSSCLLTCSLSSPATSIARGWICYRTSYSEFHGQTLKGAAFTVVF